MKKSELRQIIKEEIEIKLNNNSNSLLQRKLQNYPESLDIANQIVSKIGKDKFTDEMAELILKFADTFAFETPN